MKLPINVSHMTIKFAKVGVIKIFSFLAMLSPENPAETI